MPLRSCLAVVAVVAVCVLGSTAVTSSAAVGSVLVYQGNADFIKTHSSGVTYTDFGLATGLAVQNAESLPNPLLEELGDGQAALTPYVRVDQSGVTIITPRADLGQGGAVGGAELGSFLGRPSERQRRVERRVVDAFVVAGTLPDHVRHGRRAREVQHSCHGKARAPGSAT